MQLVSQAQKDYKWVNWLLIVAVFYVPLLNPVLPKTSFGAGLPDLDLQRITLLLLISVIGWKLLTQSSFFFVSKWLYWLYGLTFIVLISPAWADNYSYNVTLLQDMMTNAILPVLVAVVALATLRGDVSIKRYCIHAVVVVNALSLYAVFQFVTGSSFSESGELRSSATMGNANLLAIYLVLLQPIVIYATETKLIPKWIGYATLAILVVAIITTISRKGMITCFITFEVYFYLTKRYKELALSLVAALLAGIIAAGYSEITGRFDNKSIEMEFRGKAAMADSGFNMFKDNPVLGLGYKGYFENFSDYFRTSSTGRKKYDAHNEYITAMANFGLVGFVLFLGVFLYPLRRGWKYFKFYKKYRSQREMMRVMIGLTSLVSFMMSQYYAGAVFFHAPLAVCMLYANIALMLTDRKLIMNE